MKITHKQSQFSLMPLASWAAMTTSLFSVGCVDAPKPTKMESNLTPSGAAAKYDISKASLSASVEKREQSGIAKGEYPSITLTLSGAAYAEVWRCGASFKLVYGNGLQELSAVSKSDPDYRSIAKEAFDRMRTSGSDCTAISIDASSPQINDYGAQSGNFYYVINPCVSGASSTTGRGGCSYALQLTPPMQYTNTRAKGEVEILSGMYQAEGLLYTHFKEMERTLVSANAIATTCVLDEADRLYAQTRMGGLIKLVTAIAGPVVNALVPGVGAVLTTAVNAIVNLKQQQSTVFNSDCPAAQAKLKDYQDLVGKVDEIAQGVLAQRQKLSQLDADYASVDKEIEKLKSSLSK